MNDNHSYMHNFMRRENDDSLEESKEKDDVLKANQGQIVANE